MAERFRALRAISSLFKVLAWITGIFGVIAAIASPFVSNLSAIVEIGNFVGILLFTALDVLVLYGASELIMLLISIEEHTRGMRDDLSKRPPLERVA
jgi:NADH:ubiquinone oxidoreductase subunit 2 (subunit N)